MAVRLPYTASAPKSRGYLKSGFSCKKFGGLVTGIGPSNVPQGVATAMLNVDRENGSAGVRAGYRNIIAADSSASTIKGFFPCQTYVSGTLHESVIAFIYNYGGSGQLRAYEIEYDNVNDTFTVTEIQSATGSVNLNNTFWRVFCFGDTCYFVNPNDTNKVYQYSLGTHNTLKAVAPPADPSAAPTIAYYRSGTSYDYTQYLAAQASYAAGDVTTDGVHATTVTIVNKNIKVKVPTGSGSGTATATCNLKHSGGSADLTNVQASYVVLTVNDTTLLNVDLENATFTLNGGGSQILTQSVARKSYDKDNQLKSVTYYLRHTVAEAAATTLAVSFFVNSIGASDDYVFIQPFVAGGLVDWGDKETFVSQAAYTSYDSTGLFESGLSPALNLDWNQLQGGLPFGKEFPMGTVPKITMVAGSGDKLRLYGRQGHKANAGQSDTWSSWGRIVEQSAATLTYSWTITPTGFQALTPYAPSSFDNTAKNAFVWNNFTVWLYPGGQRNVRITRYGTATAQASNTDAFNTSIAIDDVLRGNNLTLNLDFQDDPLGGLSLGDAAFIAGKRGVYLMWQGVSGLPKDVSDPQLVAGAPGCFGPNAFCRFHDGNGVPIVIYLDARGDQLWAVRVPRGFYPDQPVASAAWEYGALIRGAMDTYLFGGSALRDSEAASVHVDEFDDSLHIRYNVREIKQSRPDIVDGQRHWEPYQYNLDQYGSGWEKWISFKFGTYGYGVWGIRLNGAVDEFYRANVKNPSSGDRMYLPIVGSGVTPVSLTSTALTFTNPTGWATGVPFTVPTSGNGLTAGTTYYYRRLTATTAAVYDTQAHADNTGSTVGRVTLTNTGAWASGALTPLGRDDGTAITSGIYWQGASVLGARRKPRRAHVQKGALTDVFTVTVYDDLGNSVAATIGSGRYHAPFAPTLKGFELSYRIGFAESNHSIDGVWTEETSLGQDRNV